MGMDPFSWMAIAALVGGAVGTGMQVDQSQKNADAKRKQAGTIDQAGLMNATQVYNSYSDIMAKQITGWGANGVAESGSALEIEAAQAFEREKAVRAKLMEAHYASEAASMEATNYDNLALNQGIAGFTSILGTGTKMLKPSKGLNYIPNA